MWKASRGGYWFTYLIGSIPPLMVYSMGLSGWFFEYPIWLVAAIFLLLAVPLLLIPFRSPKAPTWNIAMLWVVVALMTLRSISVFVESGGQMSREELADTVVVLSQIVGFSIVWALLWTGYFKKSVRVRNTFASAAR